MDEIKIQLLNYPSPAGNILLTFQDTFLVSATFTDHLKPDTYDSNSKLIIETRSQLDQYFSGELYQFNLPVQPHGTLFQQDVWLQLQNIPYGETWTYAELAEKVGGPNYSRAVGLANGNNPIAIIIPCHRVIGSNGSLVGYAGGLKVKKWLLDHERRHKYGVLELFRPDI